MGIVGLISRWSERKTAWFLLFASALILQIIALYFQYGMGLLPCTMCIYQRTAMYGILLSGLLVLLVNTTFTRFLGYAGWAISAGWGWLLAREHVYLLNNSNPFFSSCEIVPNFPVWLPLHEWLPAIFAAKGDCLDDSWQFMSMGMAEWMVILFGAYFVTFIVVLGCRLVDKKRF